jgi:dihydroxyacetone kinase-like predicted kinase
MSKKPTAVEYLFEEFFKVKWDSMQDNRPIMFEQAKEMEKQQMKDAALSNVTKNEGLRKIFEKQFEEYYKETYELS